VKLLNGSLSISLIENANALKKKFQLFIRDITDKIKVSETDD